MADIHDDFHERTERIRKEMIGLKWQTEELISVSREIVRKHRQFIKQRRELTTIAGGDAAWQAFFGGSTKVQESE